MELHRHYIVVMDEDGTFHKANPVDDAEIGLEISYVPKKSNNIMHFFFSGRKRKTSTRIAAMTALVIIITFPLYSWYNGNKAYAYVNVDLNPSLEMKINEEMYVLDINPLNEEAERLLEQIGPAWQDKSVEQVTSLIIDKTKDEDMLDNPNRVIIGVSYLKDREKDKYITKALDEFFSNHPDKDLRVATFEVPEKIRQEAQSEKVSMNKLMAEELTNEEAAIMQTENQEPNIDSREKEIIQSFYNTKNEKDSTQKKQDEANNQSGFTNKSTSSRQDELGRNNLNISQLNTGQVERKENTTQEMRDESNKEQQTKGNKEEEKEEKNKDHKPPVQIKSKDGKKPETKVRNKHNDQWQEKKAKQGAHQNGENGNREKNPPGLEKKKDADRADENRNKKGHSKQPTMHSDKNKKHPPGLAKKEQQKSPAPKSE